MLKKLKGNLGFKIETTTIQERFNVGVEFTETPTECYCPYCKAGVVTHVKFQNTCFTYTIAFLILMLLGWVSFIILPFIWTILQTCIHLCPNCQNTISYKRRCEFPEVSRELITIRIGGCAIVLSKKYFYALLAICAILFFFVIIRWLNILRTLEEFHEGQEISNKWKDFLASCGARGQFSNYLKSEKMFNEIYNKKSISWEGVLLRIFEDFWGKTILLVKMNPSQFPSNEYADLSLIAKSTLKNKVAELDIGDLISFKATMISLGRRTEHHLAYMWQMEKVSIET